MLILNGFILLEQPTNKWIVVKHVKRNPGLKVQDGNGADTEEHACIRVTCSLSVCIGILDFLEFGQSDRAIYKVREFRINLISKSQV